jgi:hypothetical protein
MSETNMGALTGSKTYTGTVDSTNIFHLDKFNINSPGSFPSQISNGMTAQRPSETANFGRSAPKCKQM